MWTCFALTKAELCAECCARITVFHKLNDSESVAVRRYLMLVVCWWLNTWACLQRMVLTLAGRLCSDCFTSFSGTFLFFFKSSPFPFIKKCLLVLKATDPWRLVLIVGDILYLALRYTMFVCEKQIESFCHIQAIIASCFALVQFIDNGTKSGTSEKRCALIFLSF